MMLVEKANRRSFGRTNLRWRFPGRQALALGESLDRHFTLYCPADYAVDPRYVLTPKLVALLTERATTFDVEIIDNRLLMYGATPLRMTEPATYQLLGDLVARIVTALLGIGI